MNPQLLSLLALFGAATGTVVVAPRVARKVAEWRGAAGARQSADPRARAQAAARAGRPRFPSSAMFGMEPPVALPQVVPPWAGGPGPSYYGPPAVVQVPEIPAYADPVTGGTEAYNPVYEAAATSYAAPAQVVAAPDPVYTAPEPVHSPQLVAVAADPESTSVDYFATAPLSGSRFIPASDPAPQPTSDPAPAPQPTSADYFASAPLSGSRFIRR